MAPVFRGRLLFWASAAFALVMASLQQPIALPGDPGDKLQHMIAFAVLALLAAFAYPRIRLLTIFAGLSAFSALIKLVQLISALKREADWIDWAAGTLAAAAVLGAVFLLRRLRQRSAR